MGSIIEKIQFNFKNKNDSLLFIDHFNDKMNDCFVYENRKLSEKNITFDSEKYSISSEHEPFFNSIDDYESIAEVIQEFLELYSIVKFDGFFERSFGNCGDTTIVEYSFNKESKELKIRSLFADQDSLSYCYECDEDFEEPLMYLTDYKEGEIYHCPYCGEEISLDVSEYIKIIKIKQSSKLDYYKKIISECTDEMEFLGIIEGFKIASMIYCNENDELKNEIIKSYKNDVSLKGMEAFLKS